MLLALFEVLTDVLTTVWIARLAARAVPKSRLGVPVHKKSLQSRLDNPIYKRNLQRLIERNRKFEDATE